MRGPDLPSPQGFLPAPVGLLLATPTGVGIRLVPMLAVRARRGRANRRINERLRTPVAACGDWAGSFAGALLADPGHRRGPRRAGLPAPGRDGDGPDRPG